MMKLSPFIFCLAVTLLTDAAASDNGSTIAFARKNADKFKTELVEANGVTYGSAVTLQGFLDQAALIGMTMKYDPENGEMVIEAGSSALTHVMFSESCSSNGSYLGQNAYGAKANVRQETCHRFWASDGDVSAVPIVGVRLKMSPNQFRSINKLGVAIELDFSVGHPKHDVTVEYMEAVNRATVTHPVQSRMKVWTVFGHIKEVRWVLPSDKGARGEKVRLWSSARLSSQ